MFKKITAVLVMMTMVFAALPYAAVFAEPTMVESIDLTIEPPQDGMDLYEGDTLALTAANTAYGDLFASGDVTMPIIEWQGDFDRGMYFSAGVTYMATIKLSFDGDYCANYRMVDGWSMVSADTFCATVNGVEATVRQSAAYYPTLQVSLTIPAKDTSPEEQAAANAQRSDKYAQLRKARRSTAAAYTQAEADSLNEPALSTNTVVMNGSDKPDSGYTLSALDGSERIGTLIMDLESEDYANKYVEDEFASSITRIPYLKEVWIRSRSDAAFYTAKGTVFIPESSLADYMAQAADRGYVPNFTVKTYSGDVYSAQKAGAAEAKDICIDHEYTAEIMTADRIYHYETCMTDRQWFYSCSRCGKCEYNPNHTFNKGFGTDKPVGKLAHQFVAELATDEAYVGVNASGDQVYWLSCIYCGRPSVYYDTHLTQEDMVGRDGTLEQNQALMNEAIAMKISLAKSSAEPLVEMFAQQYKSTANVSSWAQSDVNYAMNSNLLDADLLGDDYTAAATRLQFCSVAVRLAEELTGKSITPAPSDTFSDTDNAYVLKAYAAGITSGISATEFAPESTLTRQQMATFIYRALQYVKNNSDYTYTSYTSKLDSYSDNALIQDWAREPMAFMNALDLIKGISDTEISPDSNCTIEQALIVAERSTYANQIGWYQTISESEDDGFISVGFSNNNYKLSPLKTSINTSLNYGERIWVTGHRAGGGFDESEAEYNISDSYYPTINPYSGQTQYFESKWLRPIRN